MLGDFTIEFDFHLGLMLSVLFLYFLSLIFMATYKKEGRILFYRELQGYFTTTYGYIVLILMIFFIGMVAIQGGAMMNSYLNNRDAPAIFDARNFSFFLMLGIPLLTMRSISAEREENTLELLVSSPVSMWTVVSTKFLSAFFLYFLGLLVSLLIPFYIDMKVDRQEAGLDWAAVFGVYLGLILVGASLIAAGIFISSLCSRQLTALILILIFCFMQLTMQVFYQTLSSEQELARQVLEVISIMSHIVSISYSLEHALYWKDLFYLMAYTFLFLLGTALILERRRQ